MNPLLTLSAGILAGVVAVRWLKNAKTRAAFDAAQKRLCETTASSRKKAVSAIDVAQHKLRDAAITGLNTVESSSAKLRGKLTTADVATAKKAAARRAPRKTAIAKTVKTAKAKS